MYTTIATTGNDGAPWAAPQFTVYDAATNVVYWLAARTSRHVQNITHNHQAYIVAYDSMAAPGQGKGVYLQTHAEELTNQDDIARVHAQLITKHQGVPYWSLEDVQKDGSALAIIKANILAVWVNEGREQDGQFVLHREPIEL